MKEGASRAVMAIMVAAVIPAAVALGSQGLLVIGALATGVVWQISRWQRLPMLALAGLLVRNLMACTTITVRPEPGGGTSC